MLKKVVSMLAAVSMTIACMPGTVMALENEPAYEFNFDDGADVELVGGAEIAEGKTGGGLKLNGTDGYAVLPENIITEEMTVALWVKFDSLSAWMRAFDFGAGESDNFFLAPAYARTETHDSAGVNTLDFAGETERNTWVHYAVTADSESMRVYRNGQKIAEKTGLDQDLTNIKNTMNYLGKSQYAADPYFKGSIDSVKIYDSVLTDEEILAIAAEDMNAEDIDSVMTAYAIENETIVLGDSIGLKFVQTDNLSVSWSSDKPEVIDENGNTVHTNENEQVTLTMTVKIGDAEKSESYTVYVPSANEAPFTVNINAADRTKDVSDIMWGLFFEDINSAADGGLYAEMVQNGSFEYPDNLYSWTVESEGGTVSAVSDANRMNDNNPTYITAAAGDTIKNDGYMGMSIDVGAKYDFSMYVRNDAYAEFAVSLGGDAATVSVPAHEGWQKVEVVLTAAETADDAVLTVTNTGATAVCIDFVSVMPQDTYKGHGLRRDLCEAIEELEPKFLRFPGGCAVEGRTMELAWNWKDTIGDLTERKQMENIWNTGSEPYIMTYGLGFYEYFQLCEDMGMEAVPIINCGIACQVRSGSSTEEEYLVPLDELQPYIQDAIDLVAFANGTDPSNEWTAKRIEMGHPEPFNIKYIGIGNEQYGDIYFERYELFAKVLREAYPDMELNLVTTTGTASSGASNDLAWNWINEHNEYADVVDEHYYESADWFRTHAYRYDNYRRDSAKVFLGEYASKGNTWYNALCEAAFMTGLERNADVVRMASYAPLFAKYGNTQWTAADMIWFTNSDMVLTPNYYIQQMFSTNSGDWTLDTDVAINGIENDDNLKGGIAVGTWKTQAEFKDIEVRGNSQSGAADVIYSGFGDGWTAYNGDWSVNEDGSVKQTTEEENCLYYLDNDTWNNYTVTLKAKKTGGNEGFLIGVALDDSDDLYWANIGGWSNTASKIQKVTAGTAETIANVAEQCYTSEINIENDRWYDIRVEVTDYEIKAYVDGELACSYTKPKEYGPVYASAVFDETTQEYVVKLVNLADADTKVRVNLNGAEIINPTAEVTMMTGDVNAVNTLENRLNIIPQYTTLDNVSGSFDYNIKANSVNVLRIGAGGSKKRISTPGGSVTAYYDKDGVLTGIKLYGGESAQ